MKKNTNKVLAILLPALVLVFLFVVVLLSSGGYNYLGGEGNYFLDVEVVKNIYNRFSWSEYGAGFGVPVIFSQFSYPIFDIFSAIESLPISDHLVSIVKIFLIYGAPFLSMYLALSVLMKLDYKKALLLSILYLVTPFTVMHLESQMYWNVAPMYLLPIVFGVIYKFYEKPKVLFILIGLMTVFTSYGLTNVPYLALFHLFVIAALIIISYYREEKFNWRKILKNFVLLEISFILFNLWWLIPLFYFYLTGGAAEAYSMDFALNWATQSKGDHSALAKIFSLRPTISFTEPGGSFFSRFYNHPIIQFLAFLPFVAIVTYFIQKRSKDIKKVIYVAIAFLLLVIFLTKGANEPFGYVYLLMMKYVPFFYLFKSPFEKFSLYLILFTILSLAFILKDYKKRAVIVILIIYIAVFSLPYFTLNIFPEFELGENKVISKKYIDKPAHKAVRQSINLDEFEQRILMLPASNNYQETFWNHGKTYYRGMNPFVYSIKHPSITIYANAEFDYLYTHLSSPNINRLFQYYNVATVLLNHEAEPSFGFRHPEPVDMVERILENQTLETEDFMSQSLFRVDKPLPKVFPAKTVTSIEKCSDLLALILNGPKKDLNKVYYCNDRNPKEIAQAENYTLPNLEFKQISPVKYRVRAHNVTGDFPLVLNQSFDKAWSIYLGSKDTSKLNSELLEDYNKSLFNQQYQATQEEVHGYIDRGLVTTLGNGEALEVGYTDYAKAEEMFESFTVDFISSQNYNVIQNNNLPDGSFFETLNQNKLELNKFRINTLSTGWMIEPDKLEETQPKKITKNPDGSYDFELIIYHNHQKIFVISKLLAAITILVAFGYLFYILLSKRKKHEG